MMMKNVLSFEDCILSSIRKLRCYLGFKGVPFGNTYNDFDFYCLEKVLLTDKMTYWNLLWFMYCKNDIRKPRHIFKATTLRNALCCGPWNVLNEKSDLMLGFHGLNKPFLDENFAKLSGSCCSAWVRWEFSGNFFLAFSQRISVIFCSCVCFLVYLWIYLRDLRLWDLIFLRHRRE